MTETTKRLEDAVRELQSHLSQIHDLDAPSKQLLADAVEGIQAKLRKPEAEEANWSERLSDGLKDLEASHPGLATMVTRVCDFLDQAGI